VEEEKKVWKKMKDLGLQAVKLIELVKKFQNYIIVDF
jgi:hypothetical protein